MNCIFFLKIGTFFCFFAQWFGKYTYGLKAEVYSTRTFDFIQSTPYPHFIMFYAPWCQHCEKLLPLWDRFAEEHEQTRRIKVAKIDCVENTPLCASEDIKAYPTLRLFANREKYTYRGYRNVYGFNDFVKEKAKNLKDGQVPLPTDTEAKTNKKTVTIDIKHAKALIVTQENYHDIVNNGYAFIDFYAPWCPHCIKLEPIWNQVAARYQHDENLVIGKIDCTAEPDICKEELIRAYPTLNLYKNGVMINQYNGPRTLPDITDFIESNVDRLSLQGVYDNPTSPPHQAIYVTGEEMKSLIQTHNVLAYYHHPRQEKSVDHEGTLDNLEEFYSVAKYFDNVPKTAVKVIIIDCEEQWNFCSSKMLIKKFPTVFLYLNGGTRIKFFEGRFLRNRFINFVRENFPDKKHEEL